jgi:hypothetical protein
MTRFSGKIALAFGLLTTGALQAGSPAGMVLIANEGVRVDRVNTSALKDVYIGRTTYWEGGQNVVLAVLTGQTDAALKELTGMDGSQFKTFWQRLVFSGRGQQPKKADDAATLVALVAATKGAIALVPADVPLKGVKVVEVN